MKRTTSTLLVLATLLATGCIELPADMDAARAGGFDPVGLPPQEGTMTADEDVEERENLCLTEGQFSLPRAPLHCVTRTTTVTGRMTLSSLPFEVRSDTGDVEVVPSDAGSWSLVFTVTSSGATPDEARAGLDETEVSWSIDGAIGHHLLASAIHRDQDEIDRNRILVQLALPPGALYAGFVSTSTGDATVGGLRCESLTASTSTGDILVENVRAAVLRTSASTGDTRVTGEFSALDASASTGDVDLAADAVDVRASTSTGDVTATITPTASGRIDLGASTGSIVLTVPEDDRHGYRIEAETSTGKATIALRDGETTTSEDHDRASFTTSGFARRAIATVVMLDTSTGDITVQPK